MIIDFEGKKIKTWQEAFAKPGVYAVVGAGGKTTLCFSAARELWRAGKKVVVTTTTHMLREKGFLPESQREFVLAQLAQDGFVFTGGEVQAGKVTAISEDFLLTLKEKADYVLVEADGSARHPLKAPAAHEPAVPECADYLVVVGGMSALGQTIEKTCHRVEQVCDLLEVPSHFIVNEENLAEILWKGYGEYAGLPVIFVLSQVEGREEKAAKVAEHLRKRMLHG